MHSLTGLVVEAKRGARVVELVRAAFLASGATSCEPGDGTLQVRVGRAVGGRCLVTDSSVVTFDAAAAEHLARTTPCALFAVRDLGYVKGKRRERAAFDALGGWRDTPAGSKAQHVVAWLTALELWPEPWALESRAGATLSFRLPPGRASFPSRDSAEARQAALEQREASLLLNLQPHLTKQGPEAGEWQTLQAWLPAALPAQTEAVVSGSRSSTLRSELWCNLVRRLNEGGLVFDLRTANVLASLRSEPPPSDEVERHPSMLPVEEAAAWLVKRLRDEPAKATRNAVVLAAGWLALRQSDDRVLSRIPELAAAAAAELESGDERLASRAGALVSVVGRPLDLSTVLARAVRHPAYATEVANAAFTLALSGRLAPASACLDAVQAGLTATDDLTQWAHAHALWLGAACDRPSERRLELALQYAGEHAPTLVNAILTCERSGDRTRAATLAKQLRAIDKRPAILKRYAASK